MLLYVAIGIDRARLVCCFIAVKGVVQGLLPYCESGYIHMNICVHSRIQCAIVYCILYWCSLDDTSALSGGIAWSVTRCVLDVFLAVVVVYRLVCCPDTMFG